MVRSPTQRIALFAFTLLPWLWSCESVNVVAIDVAQVEVSPSILAISPGGSGQLTARVLDGNGAELMGRTVSWSSSDPGVATVSPGGNVEAVVTGSATVSASSEGISGTATVTVSVTGQIELSTSMVEFQTEQGGGVAPTNVQVTNGGSGSLTNLQFIVEYDGQSGWLSPSLNQSTTPATLTVATNLGVVSGLSAGIYGADIVISAANASNSPLRLPVELQITSPGPAIGLTPSSRAFAITEGGTAPNQTVSITNVGGGSLTGLSRSVTYGSGATGWLGTSLSRATAPATLTLSLNGSVSGLSVGVYSATVRVSSNVASSRDVAVTLTVGEPPASIGLSRSSVTFVGIEGGANPMDETVTVTNLGGGTLTNISVSDNAAWLTATRSTASAPSTITMSVNQAGLAGGTHEAIVTVTSPVATNSPQQIAVTLNLLTAAEIVLSKGSESFSGEQGGPDPAFKDIAITNGGEAPLTGLSASVASYGGGQEGWLTAAVIGSTDAPTTLRLTPTVGARIAATLTAVVEVASPVATNSPDTVLVTFVIDVSPPAAPTDLKRESSTTTSITISFQDNANTEEGFVVERDGVQIGTPAAEPGIGGRVTFPDVGPLSPGTRYDYEVWAQNVAGPSSSIAKTFRTSPSGPSSLSAVAQTETSVNVSWVSPNGDGVTFDVQRSLTGVGSWSVVTTGLASGATSYTDTTAPDGTELFYRVVARIPAGDSAVSNVDSDTTPLSAPTSFSATSIPAGTAVNLAWSDQSVSEDGYEVRSALAPAAPTASSTTGANAESATVSPLLPGTAYRFQVCAERGPTLACSAIVDETTTGVDLTLTNTPSGATALVGESVTFAVVLQNKGPSTATNVAVAFEDSAWTYDSDDGGGAFNAGSGIWSVATLANGSSTTINVVYVAPSAGLLSVTVTATADQTETSMGDETGISASVLVS